VRLFNYVFGGKAQRDFFNQPENPYSDSGSPVGITMCAGCKAKDAHINDLRSLLANEQRQREMLINRMLGINQVVPETKDQVSGVLGGTGLRSMAERRRHAAAMEAEQTGQTQNEGKSVYWENRNRTYKEEERRIRDRIKDHVTKRDDPKSTGKIDPVELGPEPGPEEDVDIADTTERAETRAALDT
jgi:hypothetical protein